jgi:flavorubredoxin
MAIIVIVYDSLCGNTELLAHAVAEGIGTVEGISTNILKVGSKFSITALNDIDVLIIGSPSVYGDMTPQLRAFLTNLLELSEQQKLRFTGVKGAVFGSYEWDGAWHLERIEAMLINLGIELIALPLAIANHGGEMRIHPHDLHRARELGNTVRIHLESHDYAQAT